MKFNFKKFQTSITDEDDFAPLPNEIDITKRNIVLEDIPVDETSELLIKLSVTNEVGTSESSVENITMLAESKILCFLTHIMFYFSFFLLP